MCAGAHGRPRPTMSRCRARHHAGHTDVFDDAVACWRCSVPRRRWSSRCGKPGGPWGRSSPEVGRHRVAARPVRHQRRRGINAVRCADPFHVGNGASRRWLTTRRREARRAPSVLRTPGSVPAHPRRARRGPPRRLVTHETLLAGPCRFSGDRDSAAGGPFSDVDQELSPTPDTGEGGQDPSDRAAPAH